MKVILEQDFKKLGKKGDIVEASEGYARNYLFPHGIAIEATKANMNVALAKKGSAERKKQQDKDEAVLMAAQLKKVEVTLRVRVGENGKLFGSVTGKDIAEVLKKEHNIDIDRRKIELKEDVKRLGDYDVVVKVHPSITSSIKVHVVAE